MMERLTEMQSDGCYDLKDINGEWCNKYCEKQRAQTCKKCGIYQAIQKLAEYENSEEQGLLLRLPCKVEDKIYVYDIDKVIAKLEELDVKSITRYKNGNFGDFDGIEYYIKKREAIEIVKQGIVSDDVCEWSYDKHFEFAKSECGSMDTHRIEFKKLKYCPYCSKKIKVIK